MAKLNIDTDKVKIAGEDLIVIASDYNKIMTELYNKITLIEQNGIWISESENGAARKFINSALRDRTPALALGSDIKNLGNKIISYANNINNISDSKL